MTTEKHPYQKAKHFATGGYVPGLDLQARGEKPEFNTLCGRKFLQGHSEIMEGGAIGAQNTTCKICKEKLKANV